MSEEKIENKEVTAPAETAPKAQEANQEKSARPFAKKRFEARRKVCKFCAEKIENVDYKNIQLIKSFTMESGKILSRRITGTSAKHQRQITKSIKRDRNLAFLAYCLP